ncbi:MAG: hypothetical protein QGI52_05505 [Alphaproteobacteria bacterium]|nr:hypothetical protein [Alphaproteobacteria bacterium]
MHEHNRNAGADHTQESESRQLQKRYQFEIVKDEGRIVAQMNARDDGAGDRGDDHRGKRAQRIMADHHFEGEKGAGDRRVERRRDGGGDAAAEQGERQRAAQLKALAEP